MASSTATKPQEQHESHVLPLWLLAGVFAALLGLTAATVGASRIDLGEWNIWIALAIAAVKASLVALIFMHLLFEKPFYGLILVITLIFVALFIGFSLLDAFTYTSRQPATIMLENYEPAMHKTLP